LAYLEKTSVATQMASSTFLSDVTTGDWHVDLLQPVDWLGRAGDVADDSGFMVGLLRITG
jgi:hypothetical protein